MWYPIFAALGMWSQFKDYLGLFSGLVCAPRGFPASSQLVLAYFHLNRSTISCNCVATVIPLICNVWSACAKCWSWAAGASAHRGIRDTSVRNHWRTASAPPFDKTSKTERWSFLRPDLLGFVRLWLQSWILRTQRVSLLQFSLLLNVSDRPDVYTTDSKSNLELNIFSHEQRPETRWQICDEKINLN